MASSAYALRASTLKAIQWKHWAFLTGQPLSGTKAVLQANVLRGLDELTQVAPRAKRIVSVDMGIRNLAFCAVDTPSPDTPSIQRIFKIGTWKRIDVTQSNHTTTESLSEDEHYEQEERKVSRRMPKEPLDRTIFSPSVLCQTAASLVRSLSSHSPDAVLIERQRFRTAGRAGIQEWTVRVNMLEAMLWASFETLRPFQSSPPTVHEVLPSRVASFWIAGQRVSLTPPPDLFRKVTSSETAMFDVGGTREKIDKQDKINIVKSWIAGQSDVKLAFTEETANVAAAFERNTPGKAGKLDDLADCLLQAIAWSKWEENQREIRTQWGRAVAEIDRPPDSADG